MMEIMENNMLKQLELYEEVFDIVRIVDPVKKRVIKLEGNKAVTYTDHCYSLWQANGECRDCISMKALNDKRTLTKMQHNGDKMYFMFAVPLMVKGEALVLELIKEITDDFVFETVYHGQENEVLNVAQHINTLILRDPLTDLYNRRHIDRMLPQEISRCTYKHPLSAAMVDIDHFKSINDTYGHYAGDIVLKKFTKTLLKYIRDDVDWAARYGGEEFLICLPNTDSKKAYKIAERIRKAVEGMKIKVDGEYIRITCSIGLCTADDSELRALDLIKCADDKLYEAKNQGRNRVAS